MMTIGFIEKAKSILSTAIQLNIEPLGELEKSLQDLLGPKTIENESPRDDDKENMYPLQPRVRRKPFAQMLQTKKPLGFKIHDTLPSSSDQDIKEDHGYLGDCSIDEQSVRV